MQHLPAHKKLSFANISGTLLLLAGTATLFSRFPGNKLAGVLPDIEAFPSLTALCFVKR